MRQQDNVSEMFVTSYLFLLYFITKDGRKLICFLFVYSQVTEMLETMFAFSRRLSFLIAQASLATLHCAEHPGAHQRVTCQSQINWWTKK